MRFVQPHGLTRTPVPGSTVSPPCLALSGTDGGVTSVALFSTHPPSWVPSLHGHYPAASLTCDPLTPDSPLLLSVQCSGLSRSAGDQADRRSRRRCGGCALVPDLSHVCLCSPPAQANRTTRAAGGIDPPAAGKAKNQNLLEMRPRYPINFAAAGAYSSPAGHQRKLPARFAHPLAGGCRCPPPVASTQSRSVAGSTPYPGEDFYLVERARSGAHWGQGHNGPRPVRRRQPNPFVSGSPVTETAQARAQPTTRRRTNAQANPECCKC